LGIAWCFISFGLEGYFWVNSFGESGSSAALTTVSFVLDSVIAVCLFTAIIVQSTYLPHTLAACSAAEDWQVTGNETSLFTQVAVIQESTAPDVCKDFVNVWIMCIVMM
jgi:hypothetical protein